ncbi:PREDICTED: uncharacterized protein LOC104828476 [Haliaeetus leucocephalus]|uniref:uncharacterized protein LOC104828476 n=1 Tax=Haliaeetus leucocephalus TaxID=52644 RepID=UPI00053CCD06|nr:PREDICTED: uncharacterized protein LOC104828476 [Haliaeetus leucocephalus]
MPVLVSHSVSAVLEQKGNRWVSPSRFLKYQAILVEQDDVNIVITNIVNPTAFLSGDTSELVTHDCLETMETVYSSRPDLKEEPLEDAEESWFMDGSSFVKQGNRKAGYAVTTTHEVIEAESLPAGTSAQKAEIIALTRALELARGKRINIWIDSKYAFGVLHAHGVIWKKRGLLTAQGKQIKHAEEILQLLEAVKLPEKVTVMHCRGHQKGNTEQEIGNKLADHEAKQAAEQAEARTLTLIPDGKLQTLNLESESVNYSEEDRDLINSLGEKEQTDAWVYRPDGRIIIPFSILWKLTTEEHNKTHWGADALYKYLNERLIGCNLYMTVKVTQHCELCLRNNPNRTNRTRIEKIGKGNIPGQEWQVDFSELPRKGGYWYLLVLTDTFAGWPKAFPCRTNKARELT